jgi:hypothetical protein
MSPPLRLSLQDRDRRRRRRPTPKCGQGVSCMAEVPVQGFHDIREDDRVFSAGYADFLARRNHDRGELAKIPAFRRGEVRFGLGPHASIEQGGHAPLNAIGVYKTSALCQSTSEIDLVGGAPGCQSRPVSFHEGVCVASPG